MNIYVKGVIGLFVLLAVSLSGIAGYKTYNNPVKSFVENVVETGQSGIDEVVNIPTRIKDKIVDTITEIVQGKLPKVKCTTWDERQRDPNCKWADDATRMRDSP